MFVSFCICILHTPREKTFLRVKCVCACQILVHRVFTCRSMLMCSNSDRTRLEHYQLPPAVSKEVPSHPEIAAESLFRGEAGMRACTLQPLSKKSRLPDSGVGSAWRRLVREHHSGFTAMSLRGDAPFRSDTALPEAGSTSCGGLRGFSASDA